MNLCFIINRKYIELLIVVIKSIIETNDMYIKLFIVNSELTESDFNYIRGLTTSNYELIDIKVDGNIFINAPLLRVDFSLEGYYKLLLPYVLPKEINRVLYIDCDTIIKKNLNDLYNMDINEYYYAAVPDRMINRCMKNYVESIGIKKGKKYYNTGVLLINLAKLREVDDLNNYITYIREKGHTFRYHDQQVINYFYHSNIKAIEEKYNYPATYYGVSDVIEHFFKRNVPVIIHYSGMKPWYTYYIGSYYSDFWRLASGHIEVEKDHRGKRGFRILKSIISSYNGYRRNRIIRRITT